MNIDYFPKQNQPTEIVTGCVFFEVGTAWFNIIQKRLVLQKGSAANALF
jgi:hypothetical protein